MNTNLVPIVKQITAQYGEAVLGDPRRLKAFFSDLAKDEPKPLRLAFGRCIEEGAYSALKTAPDAAERVSRKAAIAQRVRDEHGLDPAFCSEALDILEAALFGEGKQRNLCKSCGKELQEGWKACPFCGEAFGAARSAPPPVRPRIQTGPAAPSAPPPAPPADALAWYDRGCGHDKKKDYDRAIADYTEALRLNPNYAYTYIKRGAAYYNKGDYDRAIADYTGALRVNPDHANAYNNRGRAYSAKGDYDRAIADYNEALRINPNFADAYNNRGNAYFDKGDYDRAIADYTGALYINPDNANIREWLERARKARGR